MDIIPRTVTNYAVFQLLMKTICFFSVLATLLFTAAAQAQNPDRQRAEADKLFERANQAKAEGRPEEADKHFAAAKRLQGESREPADRGADSEQVQRLKREIKELHAAGKHDEAMRLERQLGERREHEHDGPPVPPGDRGERLRHVREAIEHLRAAGLNEPADHLEQTARKMRDEVDQSPRDFGGRPPDDEMHAAMREMHENMQALRGDVQKMARAIEELRAQVKKERNEAPREKAAP